MTRILKLITIAALLAWAAAGCVRMPAGRPAQMPGSQPAWVQLGSGAFKTRNHGDVFYGVGSASGMQSQTLLRASADNAARRQAEQVMTQFVQRLSGSVSQDDAGDLMPMVQIAMETAAIEDHWTDSGNGRLYSLCRVDLTAFKQSLSRMRGLEMARRNEMLGRADEVFAETASQPGSLN